jgi:poly-beta-1,6-N-acetyl-D-glucosamine N-deacetylase
LTACLIVALAACGQSGDERGPREALPAPSVELSGGDRERWAPAAAAPATTAIPVLVYRDTAPEDFARQMVLLDHAGYDTVGLGDFVRFVAGEKVALPARPLLLTFDGGRLDSWRESDAILRRLDFEAVMFVDVGCVEEAKPACLTWDELGRLQRSGRWDVQLQSGTGGVLIQYGPAPDDVGPFYAYRGSEEVLGGWRERVFSDVSYGEQQLQHQVEGYRPLAFAPPFGNYGQAGTNDRHIPRELLARLELSFEVVFTQDRSGFARPGAPNPLGRFEITRDTSDERLYALLTRSTSDGVISPTTPTVAAASASAPGSGG